MIARMAAVMGALGVVLAAASANADMNDQLYAKAKAEKSLVLYTGGPVGPWEARAKASKTVKGWLRL